MSDDAHDKNGWPALPYADWAETCTALHLWTQIVGKYRLAHTPWVNHSWQATLYVTPRGLSTGPVPDRNLATTLTFDLREHALVGETLDMRESFPLEAMSVADFLDRPITLVERLGGRMDIHGAPNEIPDGRPRCYKAVARGSGVRRQAVVQDRRTPCYSGPSDLSNSFSTSRLSSVGVVWPATTS